MVHTTDPHNQSILSVHTHSLNTQGYNKLSLICRGLSVHSIIVTEGGQVQLVDFRFARKNDGRAYTLCGNPEYLAPEVIQV